MAEARRRRFDPDRRDRIIEATLDVVEVHGVVGTTHRRIAEVADVPLGSMTYHFASLDELLYLAFEKMVSVAQRRFDEMMAAAIDEPDPREAVVRLIASEQSEYHRDMLLSTELYALAIRRPEYRTLTQRWMEASRTALAPLFGDEAAPGIDALIDGLIRHSYLSTEPFDEARVRRAVHRITAPDTSAG
ncbi:TetR/AcrR family transcriptional regulator [Agromyces atrinae]|uniref:DNA-binding transcriptional regulator YbjK n=1 Tax=Agromyces atrinae TaxID=592376 RepID=A0A4Q2M9H4_9MICO|nr:TetR family transcriptional regulator C-terminal domain-containing protein [Agromyces atrinae]NYD67755.1 DNA-binding transcriptional regulator YbjK [Agromyces atrinae]RXZ88057.1 TetR family transcriptional regulator [Agromyces atrinae]